ncbi:metal-sulfur cluster assembly factor [Halopenitus salinus]|uniref:Metal-sulfur cluster assembly factor n=1 Tax=Halopenitus salinus TaxID=1198295 RepID=A0ABD5URU1_9EURY
MSKRSTREDDSAPEDGTLGSPESENDATQEGDRPSRERVREALASVTDPELDRSIVELEYIDEIRFEPDGTVRVAFTLPTAWCSPAFAWMMAGDSRDVVESLPGVDRCRIELREHMHEREVNRGINEGIDFAEAFPDAEDGIADLRETLDEKAVLSRQYRATEALLAAGLDLEQIALLERSDLDREIADSRIAVAVPDRGFEVTVPAEPLERYLEKAAALDRFERSERLFRTPDGDAIDPDDAELVHRRARLARVNMDGQGGVCDALHESRQSALAE